MQMTHGISDCARIITGSDSDAKGCLVEWYKWKYSEFESFHSKAAWEEMYGNITHETNFSPIPIYSVKRLFGIQKKHPALIWIETSSRAVGEEL